MCCVIVRSLTTCCVCTIPLSVEKEDEEDNGPLSHSLCSLSHRYCYCRFIIAIVKSTVTYSRLFNRKPSNLCTFSRKYSKIVSKSISGLPESPKNMFRKSLKICYIVFSAPVASSRVLYHKPYFEQIHTTSLLTENPVLNL